MTAKMPNRSIFPPGPSLDGVHDMDVQLAAKTHQVVNLRDCPKQLRIPFLRLAKERKQPVSPKPSR
jgi:hypothetical protein